MAVSEEKIEKVHYLLTTILGSLTPAEKEGFLNRFGNPLFPMPPDEAKIDAFIAQFNAMIIGKTPEQISKEIDRRELRSLVEIYERESKNMLETGRRAELRGKTHVEELMRRALEAPVPTEQKGHLFQILEEECQRQPDKPVETIIPEAIAAVEAAQPFINPAVIEKLKSSPPQFRFSDIKGLSVIQKAVVAPALDVAGSLFPSLRPGSKPFENAFRDLIKIPEGLGRLLGAEIVHSRPFQQVVENAQKSLPTGSTPGGARSIIDGFTSSLFRRAAENSLVAYWRVYRISIAQGIQPPTIAQFQESGMGLGSTAIRMGVNIGVNEAKGAGLRWLAARAGLALVPGPGWAAALLAIGGGLIKKVGDWFRKFPGVKEGIIPGDKEIIAVGCGSILLVFFILPLVSQLNIDSSLANRFQPAGGGPSETNQYLDVAITAAPESLVGNTPTAMRYTVSARPKGSPASFKINSANITFSVYGGAGCPDLIAPPISPEALSGGNFSFVVPFCPGLQDSVITATFNVSADVGSAGGVGGSASVSTVIGNPSLECFVFGEAGQHDGYKHVSSAWDSTAAVTAAVGVLARSQVYMSRVCAGGQPITIYRVNADFGGGSTSPPNSIFMYNACATTACATYTLAHETGHIVDSRTGLFGEYTALGLPNREGYLWTYPNGFSEHEDFAETLGAYVVWHNYAWGARHGHPGGTLDYGPTGPYKIHYDFAKSVFGGVEY